MQLLRVWGHVTAALLVAAFLQAESSAEANEARAARTSEKIGPAKRAYVHGLPEKERKRRLRLLRRQAQDYHHYRTRFPRTCHHCDGRGNHCGCGVVHHIGEGHRHNDQQR